MTDADAAAAGTIELADGLTVNRMGFGAMRLCAEGIVGAPEDQDHARTVARRALEHGVDFVDTADSYGPGVSERLLREAGVPGDAVVATKAGLLRNTETEWLAHGDPDYLQNQALVSRDRLGVDSIDLLQLHRPDPDTPFADSVHALAELVDEGVVDNVGLSNVTVEQLDRAREIVDIACVQNRYSSDKEKAHPFTGGMNPTTWERISVSANGSFIHIESVRMAGLRRLSRPTKRIISDSAQTTFERTPFEPLAVGSGQNVTLNPSMG